MLVYNKIPTQSGAAADLVIGQIGGSVNQASDAADSLRTPMSLAWDGTNLYVSDAYNRRITVYSIGANTIPYTGVRNAASLDILARATRDDRGHDSGRRHRHTQRRRHLDHRQCRKDHYTGGATYKHTVVKADTISTIITDSSAAQINAANSGAGDTNVYATPDPAIAALLLTSRLAGAAGNDITVNVAGDRGLQFQHGRDYGRREQPHAVRRRRRGHRSRPGSIVSILGTDLSSTRRRRTSTKDPLARRNRRHAGLFQRHPRAARDGVAGQGERADSVGAVRYHQHQRLRAQRAAGRVGDGDHAGGGDDRAGKSGDLRAAGYDAIGRARVSRVEHCVRRRVAWMERLPRTIRRR